jgi:hypothetical protein
MLSNAAFDSSHAITKPGLESITEIISEESSLSNGMTSVDRAKIYGTGETLLRPMLVEKALQNEREKGSQPAIENIDASEITKNSSELSDRPAPEEEKLDDDLLVARQESARFVEDSEESVFKNVASVPADRDVTTEGAALYNATDENDPGSRIFSYDDKFENKQLVASKRMSSIDITDEMLYQEKSNSYQPQLMPNSEQTPAKDKETTSEWKMEKTHQKAHIETDNRLFLKANLSTQPLTSKSKSLPAMKSRGRDPSVIVVGNFQTDFDETNVNSQQFTHPEKHSPVNRPPVKHQENHPPVLSRVKSKGRDPSVILHVDNQRPISDDKMEAAPSLGSPRSTTKYQAAKTTGAHLDFSTSLVQTNTRPESTEEAGVDNVPVPIPSPSSKPIQQYSATSYESPGTMHIQRQSDDSRMPLSSEPKERQQFNSYSGPGAVQNQRHRNHADMPSPTEARHPFSVSSSEVAMAMHAAAPLVNEPVKRPPAQTTGVVSATQATQEASPSTSTRRFSLFGKKKKDKEQSSDAKQPKISANAVADIPQRTTMPVSPLHQVMLARASVPGSLPALQTASSLRHVASESTRQPVSPVMPPRSMSTTAVMSSPSSRASGVRGPYSIQPYVSSAARPTSGESASSAASSRRQQSDPPAAKKF